MMMDYETFRLKSSHGKPSHSIMSAELTSAGSIEPAHHMLHDRQATQEIRCVIEVFNKKKKSEKGKKDKRNSPLHSKHTVRSIQLTKTPKSSSSFVAILPYALQ